MSPLFMLCLDLLTCAKLATHRDREKKQKKTDNVIQSDSNLGLKRDLANKTNALIKGGRGGGENGSRQWETALPRRFARMCDTCVQSCTFSSRTQKQHTCVSLWLRDGQKKREKESTNSCCWGGGDRAAPEHHTDRSLWKERIAPARLLSCHILIPGWAHLGTDLHRAPWQRDPPPSNTHTPAIQACSCQHFHLCTVLVWCQVHTHTPKPPQQLACLMSVKTNRWGGEREPRGGWLLMLCWSVCLTIILLFK